MRHQRRNKKFGRDASSRKAMFRNLVGNLVLHERIETSDTKAKELRQVAERMLTKALRLGDELTIDVAKIKTTTKIKTTIMITRAKKSPRPRRPPRKKPLNLSAFRYETRHAISMRAFFFCDRREI